MTVYDSFTAWINSFLACMGGCLGHGGKPTRASSIYDSQKRLQFQGHVVERGSLSEDFWGTSTGDIDIPVGLSQRSISSLSTSNLSFHSDLGSVSSNSQNNEFVNHGHLLWNQIRHQWVAAGKTSNQCHDSRGPTISLNATYESLLSNKNRFRRPIPLSEMVDFLVDVWEQEGLYD